MRRSSIIDTSPILARLCAAIVLVLSATPGVAAAANVFGGPSPGASTAPSATTPSAAAPARGAPAGKAAPAPGAAVAGKPGRSARKLGAPVITPAGKTPGAAGQARPTATLPANMMTQTLPASAATASTSNNGTLMIFAGIAAVALLGGIAYTILRDARSVAPVGDGPLGGGAAGNYAVRLRKRRAKAKAGRRQRKRNRR